MSLESLMTVSKEGKLLSSHLQMLVYCDGDLEVRNKLKNEILQNLKTISESIDDAIKYLEKKNKG